jgi:hypothetical protein
MTDSFFGASLIFAVGDLVIKGLRGELIKGKRDGMEKLEDERVGCQRVRFLYDWEKGFWRTALKKPTALTKDPVPRLSVSGSVKPQAKGT